MIRLNAIVEGQTEEAFMHAVLVEGCDRQDGHFLQTGSMKTS
jgi:hypothetical protein